MFQQDIDRQNGYRPGVGLLLTKDGRILLGRGASWLTAFRFDGENVTPEQHENWKFGWDIPQGGIEVGESFGGAIRRETDEELGNDWKYEMTDCLPFRRECLDFPVNKDGRTYRGKTYYYHTLEVIGEPEGFSDWVFGHHGDDAPVSFPTPAFPGGVMFMGHRDACDVIVRSRNGRKGQLVINILNDLRHRRMIRA